MEDAPREGSKTLSIRLTPEQLSGCAQLPMTIKPGGIRLDPETLRAIDVLSRSFTGSARRKQPDDKLLRASRERIANQGLEVNLVTAYNLPPDLEAELRGKFDLAGTPYKRGVKGLEVYGPHNDRSVDVESMVRSGRINLQLNKLPIINEKIEIKYIVK